MIEKCYVIPVKKACNSNCKFCISKVRDYNNGCEYLNVDDYFVKQIELLKRRNIKKFEITGGGEPCLHKEIDKIVNIIKRIIPESYIKLYTNGNLLKYIGEISEVNISVAHYNDIINSSIMHPKKPIPLDIKLKFFRAQYPSAKIRLSIPIMKCGIKSSSELDKMIEKTQKYVDEYVVRTLYPGSPTYEEDYVDFEYNNKDVIFERENSVINFDGLILWSNGKFYKDWSITEERKLQSYLLLKPDARTYVNEIEKIIMDMGFTVDKRILLNDFYNQAINFYKDKTKEYLELVKEHLMNSVNLFGNQGVVYILDGIKSISKLEEDTNKLKEIIRNSYGFTNHYNKFIEFNNQNYHLNLVHSPDPDKDLYDRDLALVEELRDVKVLNEEDMKLIKRFRSFNV